jgi:hypothetical protein
VLYNLIFIPGRAIFWELDRLFPRGIQYNYSVTEPQGIAAALLLSEPHQNVSVVGQYKPKDRVFFKNENGIVMVPMQ